MAKNTKGIKCKVHRKTKSNVVIGGSPELSNLTWVEGQPWEREKMVI